MDGIFEQLQAFVKDLQARFSSLSTPSKFLAGLAIFALTPFVAIGGTKWKGWVKALTCFLLFCFMLCLVLGILMVALVFYLIWFIWKKAEWKTYLKVVATVGIIAVPVTLALVFGGKPVLTNVPAPSIPPVIQAAPDTMPVSTSAPALPSPSEVQATPDVTPPASETVPPTTQPPVEEENDYQKLAKNEDAYLLFLRCIGTCYKDNTLSQEMFDEMAQYDGVQSLVQDVLDYRYQNGALSPDFVSSFEDFWTDDIAVNNPDVAKALQISFDLERGPWGWVIEENADTIAAHEDADTSEQEEEEGKEKEEGEEEELEWLSATGNLYPGVELYMMIDGEPMLYGVVTELDTKGTQVQIYLAAGDNAQWFERRTPLFSDVLKVRSDDPHLPQY